MTVGRGESGQASVLVLGVALVCVAVAGLALDLTRAALLRRTLQSVADSAVTAGASQLDTRSYYASGGRVRILDGRRAQQRAMEVLETRGAVRAVQIGGSGTRLWVVVHGRLPTSFLRLIGVRHLTVGARAAAEPVFGEA